ncbi:MAG: hypothetical protein J2P47_14120, partial [Acetobacteraceae bacterium]|nr:hypothetical protein [Acetobacteraceae bacterium]
AWLPIYALLADEEAYLPVHHQELFVLAMVDVERRRGAATRDPEPHADVAVRLRRGELHIDRAVEPPNLMRAGWDMARLRADI